jgi:hypothetical protein
MFDGFEQFDECIMTGIHVLGGLDNLDVTTNTPIGTGERYIQQVG